MTENIPWRQVSLIFKGQVCSQSAPEEKMAMVSGNKAEMGICLSGQSSVLRALS